MPVTKRGIYHNLMESKYTVSNSEIVFFFSSEVYLNKFMDGYQNHRVIFLEKMAKIAVENPLNMATLADITYYKKVEKRGFFVRLKRAKITWDDLYKYALRKMSDKNTLEWYRNNGAVING
jgi:hypothetical protein